MSGEKLLVFGLGYSARAVVARMRPKLGEVWGTTRDAEKTGEIKSAGATPLYFDGGRLRLPLPNPPPQGGRESRLPSPWWGEDGEGVDPIHQPLAQADLVLVSIAPDERGDPELRHFRADLIAARPKSLV